MYCLVCYYIDGRASLVAQMVKNLQCRRLRFDPWVRKSPHPHPTGPSEGNSYLLQYSRLENSIDRRAWQATVYGVTKS